MCHVTDFKIGAGWHPGTQKSTEAVPLTTMAWLQTC